MVASQRPPATGVVAQVLDLLPILVRQGRPEMCLPLAGSKDPAPFGKIKQSVVVAWN